MVNAVPQWFDPDGRLTAAEVADGFFEIIVGRSAPRPEAGTAG